MNIHHLLSLVQQYGDIRESCGIISWDTNYPDETTLDGKTISELRMEANGLMEQIREYILEQIALRL